MAGKKQPRLTEGQKDCLRLVEQLLTSKEIARKLDISPFTVDQRLDAARRKLGAQNRKEAAIKFAAIEAGQLSEPFVYETQPVAAAGNPVTLGASNNRDGGSSEATNKSSGRWTIFGGLGNSGSSLRLTMPTLGGEGHDLSKSEVAAAIFKTALFSIICVSALTIIIVGLMQILA